METKFFSREFLISIKIIEDYSFSNPWTENMFLESAKNKSIEFKILVENKNCIGYYIASAAADEAEILKIAIGKDFRNKGFGKLLLKDIENFAVSRKLSKIFLEVSQKNTTALRLYKHFQFEILDGRKDYYRKDENALIMRKLIKENFNAL
jgi:ribosomal-protein-alanine acetyltransferase